MVVTNRIDIFIAFGLLYLNSFAVVDVIFAKSIINTDEFDYFYQLITINSIFVVLYVINRLVVWRPGGDFHANRRSFFSSAIVYLIVFVSIIYFSQQSAFRFLDRSVRDSEFFTSQIWVVVYSIMMAHSIFLANTFRSYSKPAGVLALLMLLSYFAFDVFFIAGRRLAAVIVLSLVTSIYFERSFFYKSRWKLLFFSAIFAGVVIGGLREHVRNFYLGVEPEYDVIETSLRNNEFTEIGRGHYEGIGDIENHTFGLTYFRLPFYVIPKVIFPDKPRSLTNEYKIASSPFFEAYLNFGFLAWAVLLIILPVFAWFMNGGGLYNRALFSLSLEFFRSEISLFLYTFILIVFVLFFLTRSYRID